MITAEITPKEFYERLELLERALLYAAYRIATNSPRSLQAFLLAGREIVGTVREMNLDDFNDRVRRLGELEISLKGRDA